MPVLMEPVMIDGDLYSDGGLAEAIPVEPLLNTDVDGIIAIRTFPPQAEALDKNPDGLKEMLLRTIDIICCEVSRTDIPDACLVADKRLIIIGPGKHLGNSLDFNQQTMTELWHLGFDQAGAVMSQVQEHGHGGTA